jgi:hypothetical protein
MKTAVNLADAANLGDPRDEVFDIYRAYAETLLSDPAREEETRSRQGYFHPSAIGMCARRNVYEARREPFVSHLGVQDLEIFRIGHFVHERVQGVLAEVDRVTSQQGLLWSFTPEVPYDKKKDRLFADLRTGGTCDGELTIEKPGKWKQRGVLEAKSMKDEYWQKLKRPKDNHLLQGHLYAFRHDCPIIWFWYYNKNTSQHRVFPWVYDPEIFDRAVQRLVLFNEHLDQGTLPPKEEGWYSCARCEYQEVCQPAVLKKRTTASKPGPLTKATRGFGKKGGRSWGST